MADYAASKSGLILPASLAGRPACAVCFICRREFTRPSDCERHMHRCINENADMLRDRLPQGPSDRRNWDVEYETYMRDGGTWEAWYKEHGLNPDGSER